MATKSYDLQTADVTPQRAAVMAQQLADSKLMSGGVIENRENRIVVRFDNADSLAPDYLVRYHGFSITPDQPSDGIEVYKTTC
jgi:hypothetical protein